MVAIKAGRFLALKSASTPLVGAADETATKDIETLREKLVALDNNLHESVGSGSNERGTTLRATENACREYKIGLYFGKPGEPLNRLA